MTVDELINELYKMPREANVMQAQSVHSMACNVVGVQLSVMTSRWQNGDDTQSQTVYLLNQWEPRR